MRVHRPGERLITGRPDRVFDASAAQDNQPIAPVSPHVHARNHPVGDARDCCGGWVRRRGFEPIIAAPMRPRHLVVCAALMALAAAMALPVRAQSPFAAAKSSGQTVTPAYEGWYRKPRRHVQPVVRLLQPQHAEEVVEIPIGAEQLRRRRATQNQGQPTRVSAAAALGRVRREGAGELRRRRRSSGR